MEFKISVLKIKHKITRISKEIIYFFLFWEFLGHFSEIWPKKGKAYQPLNMMAIGNYTNDKEQVTHAGYSCSGLRANDVATPPPPAIHFQYVFASILKSISLTFEQMSVHKSAINMLFEIRWIVALTFIMAINTIFMISIAFSLPQTDANFAPKFYSIDLTVRKERNLPCHLKCSLYQNEQVIPYTLFIYY